MCARDAPPWHPSLQPIRAIVPTAAGLECRRHTTPDEGGIIAETSLASVEGWTDDLVAKMSASWITTASNWLPSPIRRVACNPSPSNCRPIPTQPEGLSTRHAQNFPKPPAARWNSPRTRPILGVALCRPNANRPRWRLGSICDPRRSHSDSILTLTLEPAWIVTADFLPSPRICSRPRSPGSSATTGTTAE